MTEENGGGITGAISKPVTKAIGALQGTPMLLVLTLLNVAMFGMLTWLIMQSAQYRFTERTQLLATLTACIDKLHEKDGIRAQKMDQSPLPKK